MSERIRKVLCCVPPVWGMRGVRPGRRDVRRPVTLRPCSIWLGIALLALLTSQAQACTADARGHRGNILLIIADDVGNDKVGAYGEGDDATRPATPNIDALAHRGVRFTNAYANPVCSPTRATLLTGRYGFRTGIGRTTFTCNDEYGLPLEEIAIPELLDRAQSGYDHSQLGKWHLSTVPTGGVLGPLMHGFNWSAGAPGNLNECPKGDHFHWQKQTNGDLRWTAKYTTTDTTDDAIDRANTMAEPWFLWVAYNTPHNPRHHAPEHLHHRPNTKGDEVLMYASMLEALDTELGRLFASIPRSVLDNTTIIFLGDNGSAAAVTVPPYLPERAKGTMYEGGINIPFIVAGPAVPVSSRGQVSEALVNTTDVYTTVAELAGVNLDEVLPPTHKLDSVSILPLLDDPKHAVVREYAYAENFRPNGLSTPRGGEYAIRDARWKLIRREGTKATPDELYDLSVAPPGTDGQDLCPCPDNLSEEQFLAYERLMMEFERLRGS